MVRFAFIVINIGIKMAIPIFEDFLYPFMEHLMNADSNKAEMTDYLGDYFNLSREDRQQRTKGGNTTQLYDRVGWCLQWLRRALFVEIPNRNVWRITERGRNYMLTHTDLRETDLLKYPEFANYSGKKDSHVDVSKRSNNTTNTQAIFKHNDNWPEIVQTLTLFINSQTSYHEYYNTVVFVLKILGWKQYNATILTSPHSLDHDVKYAYIYIQLDQERRIPIVPIKPQEDLPDDIQTTIMSKSMSKWNSPVGLIIKDNIRVFYKDPQNTDYSICVLTVGFDKHDKYGTALCNLLQASNFKMELLEQFCSNEYNKKPIASNLHQRIEEISKNTPLVKELLKNYLVSLGYKEEDINEELKLHVYRIKKRDNQPENATPKYEPSHNGKYDNTKFSFDGGKTFYNKRVFVLNVVRQYIKDHPYVTLDDLEQVFPSSIRSRKRGVVRPLALVEKWVIKNPDIATRYFMSEDEIITLFTGTKIVVHNQWGTSFPKFLDIAKRLYDVRSNQLYMGMKDIYEPTRSIETTPPSEEQIGINIPADSIERFKKKH